MEEINKQMRLITYQDQTLNVLWFNVHADLVELKEIRDAEPDVRKALDEGTILSTHEITALSSMSVAKQLGYSVYWGGTDALAGLKAVIIDPAKAGSMADVVSEIFGINTIIGQTVLKGLSGVLAAYGIYSGVQSIETGIDDGMAFDFQKHETVFSDALEDYRKKFKSCTISMKQVYDQLISMKRSDPPA
jgi:hypothetical protein